MTLKNRIASLATVSVLVAVVPPGASASPVQRTARASPSFECARAATRVEKTICASPALSRADAEVATLYRQRRHELDPAAAALLTEDQRYLLAARERIFGYGDTDSTGLLRDVLAGRADFLRRVTAPSDGGLAGRWDNMTGGLTITSGAGGLFRVRINTNEPVTARWVCEIEGTGRLDGGNLDITYESDGSKVRLRRVGQTLHVEASPPPGKASWTPGYCGLNGSVDGTYFLMKPRRGDR